MCKSECVLIWNNNVSTLGTNECSREDLDQHVENTQSELDQLKDILNGYNSFDANALLGVIFMYYI